MDCRDRALNGPRGRGDRLLHSHAMNRGQEWVVDAEGCDPAALRDLERLGRLCGSIVDQLGLKVAKPPLWHVFPHPGGVTGLILLSESHLTCHTFPESGWASFNLYCCREVPAFAWDLELRRALDARQVVTRELRRGPGG